MARKEMANEGLAFVLEDFDSDAAATKAREMVRDDPDRAGYLITLAEQLTGLIRETDRESDPATGSGVSMGVVQRLLQKSVAEAKAKLAQESQEGPSRHVKMTVKLPRESAEMLRSIAQERGTTVTETLRQLISLEAFLQESRDEGAKVLVEYPNKEMRQLIFR